MVSFSGRAFETWLWPGIRAIPVLAGKQIHDLRF